MTVRKKCAPINWPSAEEIEAERDRKANQLVRRGDIIKICEHFARDHADLALYGEVDQARCREAAEAMATAIRCAVALIPEANSGGQCLRLEKSVSKLFCRYAGLLLEPK